MDNCSSLLLNLKLKVIVSVSLLAEILYDWKKSSIYSFTKDSLCLLPKNSEK